MFVRADHVAISVKDMGKVIAFYQDVVGMAKVFDRVFERPIARLIGVENARVRVVHMKLADSVIELFQYEQPTGREPRADARQCDYGLIHIGFIVQDFWGTYESLRAHGATFLGEPVEIRPGVMVAYFRGAEFEVCEIREISVPSDPVAKGAS
jgi:catechol 2,3-dioxygenase-like lactoylglutathione lyase family enzyme